MCNETTEPKNAELTEDELFEKLERAWEALHAVKVRYVKACTPEEKSHYRRAANALEQRHKDLWDEWKRGEFKTSP